MPHAVVVGAGLGGLRAAEGAENSLFHLIITASLRLRGSSNSANSTATAWRICSSFERCCDIIPEIRGQKNDRIFTTDPLISLFSLRNSQIAHPET